MKIGTKIKNSIIRKLGGIPYGEQVVVNAVPKIQPFETVQCTAEFRTRVGFTKMDEEEKTSFERWIKRSLVDKIAERILEDNLMSISYLQSEKNIIRDEIAVRGIVEIIPPEKEE